MRRGQRRPARSPAHTEYVFSWSEGESKSLGQQPNCEWTWVLTCGWEVTQVGWGPPQMEMRWGPPQRRRPGRRNRVLEPALPCPSQWRPALQGFLLDKDGRGQPTCPGEARIGAAPASVAQSEDTRWTRRAGPASVWQPVFLTQGVDCKRTSWEAGSS